MSAQTRSQIRDLLTSHGKKPVRRLGQHFLADPNIARKIVALADVGPGARVVEIGAGTGALTVALAESGAHVVAYEIDRGLQPLLESAVNGLDVELRFEDATRVDFSAALDGMPWAMVANLPYNVGTGIIVDALRKTPSITRFVVMLQSEVARRLVASSGDDEYGVPSVVAALHAERSVAFAVPPQVFYPHPNIESSVVVLDRRPAAEGTEMAIELARSAFGQRRKMLRSSMRSAVTDVDSLLERAGVEGSLRAEDLSADDYLKMAASL